MNKNEINFREQHITLERYDDAIELFDTIESRQDNIWVEQHKENVSHESSWYGVGDYDSAKKLLFSNEETREIAAKSLSKLYGEKNVKVKKEKSVIGQTVNIPNFLHNNPKTMFKKIHSNKKAKILNILIEGGICAFYSANDILKVSNSLFYFFKQLNCNNYIYKVFISYTFIDKYNDNNLNSYMCLIKVKDYNQGFNAMISNLCSCYPSTFRKIIFKWYETLPGASHIVGYGTPISTLYSNSVLSSFYDKVLNDNISNNFIVDLQTIIDDNCNDETIWNLFKDRD